MHYSAIGLTLPWREGNLRKFYFFPKLPLLINCPPGKSIHTVLIILTTLILTNLAGSALESFKTHTDSD